MQILTFSTLYPNSVKPTFAVFVENRLRHLTGSFPVKSVVIAPVPWVPLIGRFIGKYKEHANVPKMEIRHGIKVYHPRFLHLPLIGNWFSPLFLALSTYYFLKTKLGREFHFDLLDAHYFYPDGVAAVILGKMLRKPVAITARGSDINYFPTMKIPKRWILWAAKNADHIITVSNALRERLIELGADEEKVTVLRNGVELETFTPLENRDTLRHEKKYTGTVLLAVGRLEGLKGHDLIIKALAEFDDTKLLIAGDGPLRQSLEALVKDMGVQDRVTFLGAVTHEDLAEIYALADVLVLASSREGWPNVLLESLACGTPVVATNVGGVPEVVATQEAGVLAGSRSVEGLVTALHELLEHYPDRGATRKYAENFSWHATSDGQFSLFQSLVKEQ